MKRLFDLKFTALFIFLTLHVFSVAGQSVGKIAGKVTDGKTGEALIGLTVKVQGSTKGTSTDIEGRYSISGLTAGKHTLVFSYVGYSSKSVSDIVVKASQVTNADIVMEESEGNSLNEVVITASAKQESVGALYAMQRVSVRVSDGISAEQIRRSPDRNTSDVLKRVSGASIQENKFLLIRGLSDRYNTTLLNNAPLPSSEPDRKAFSFDIIPSNLVDQIVVNKTAAADLPGDFAGGVIQIKTRDFPEQELVSLNYSASYNTQSTFKDFKGGKRGGLDLLGFDDGLRDMPSSFPSNRTNYVNSSLDQRVAYTKAFKNNWGVENFGAALPTQSLQFTYGNSYTLENANKFGFIASLSYRNGNTITDQTRADIEQIGDESFSFKDDVYKNSINVGGLANFAYAFKNSKIAFKNIYNRVFDDAYTSRVGVALEEPNFDNRNSQFQLLQKSLLSSILEGEHSFENRRKLDWNASFSSSNQDQPDLRRIFYSRPSGSSEPFKASVNTGSASTKNAGRFYSDLQDYVYAGAVNYTHPFKLGKLDQIVKVGALSQYRTRDFSARELGYVRTTANAESESYLSLPQEEIFSPGNISRTGFIFDEITNPSNTYDANVLLNAGYVMLTNELAQKWKLNWGLRVESYHEKLNSATVLGTPITVDNNYVDLLPSANLIFSIDDKTNLRASYSNTVARAEFRELAPFSFFDFESNNVIIGNNNLKRSRINNFDLRFEHFSPGGQIFSLTGFYKQFKNPIEQVFNQGTVAASKAASFQNATKATLFGAELEIRQRLSFIKEADFFTNTSVYANLAIMKSDVKLDRQLFANINESRALQGQSPYLINGGIQYNDNKWGFNVLYNRIGRRINIVGFGRYEASGFVYEYPDIYENPRDVIDLQISRKLFSNRLDAKINVGDLLNQKAVLYQDNNNDKKFNPSSDQSIRTIKYGSNFSLSLGYNF
ncbi:TonB-dependent receptor [Arcticibacter pallidicorallinus]|uniref:TonB-dependent receptor n=1 Tax=Arcticibacter pallidicorallinus TaxID=1259464 RepID=A0A2T0U0K5_9SPHI|nr:TonB-dependent receptor [Arcticibacter pallidicorallinus]PRY51429.1 TonB-dependent receptor [Arcticibacter pallidicorallinus]